MTVIVITVFLVFIIAGLDVGFAMMGAAFLGLMMNADSFSDAMILPLSALNASNSSALVAVPMFVLAGELMNRGGLTSRLVAWSDAMVGHLRGSLSQVAVLTNLIMAGVTGSAVADATATGIALIPAMKKEGYRPAYAAAVIAAAAMLGPILPPSVPMLIYAVMANISVIQIFLAGFVPALLLAIGYMVICGIMARRHNYGAGQRSSWRVRAAVTRTSIWALMMPVLILGGMRSGLVTITEASAAIVVYAIVVTVFVYRDLTLRELFRALFIAGRTSSVILFLFAAAGPFSWFLSETGVANDVSTALIGLSSHPMVVLLAVNGILLIAGKILEPLPALVICIPTLLPVQAHFGIDPIQFSVIVILNLMIGMQTPPIGLLLFVVSSIGEVSLVSVIWQIFPFVLWSLTVLALITVFPFLTTWLPYLVGT
jgi:tripartite ATP-independent transporter DctM subunit